MLRQIIVIAIALVSCVLSLPAEEREGRRSVYCQYDFDAERVEAPAPKGFKPFYISHYGRHGARYIYNDSEYELLHEVFTSAAAADALTPLGRELHDRFMDVYPHFYGRAGDLTSLGQEQHRKLAERMMTDWPQIFRKAPRVNAVTSIYTRCIMSMNAFCNVLRCRGLEVEEEVDSRDMAYLAPYTRHNPKYKGEDQGWRCEHAEYFDRHFDRESFYSLLLKDRSFAQNIDNDMNFIMTLYYMDAHMAGTEFPDTGFGEVFSDHNYSVCNEMDNIKFYMRKGWGEGRQGQVNVALGESLMTDMIEKADVAVTSGSPSVDLRFGHDGAVMTLLAFLRAEGWNDEASGMEDIKNVWTSCNVPMASNVRLIFYRKGSEIIVKAQHNESDLKLPVRPYDGVFYRWTDFREFYTSLIDEANLLLSF